jgi:diaminopimelate epimerase
MKNNRLFVIAAAGGNATAIQVLESPFGREEYESMGRRLMADTKQFGAEQCGFLVLPTKHFEMAGGEFCGNAARAAAIVISELSGQKDVVFTMSGFKGSVRADNVVSDGGGRYAVTCFFPNLPLDTRDLRLEDGRRARVVDLGGIVHVIISGMFPFKPEDYKRQHCAIRTELGLGEREAVGVIWFEDRGETVNIHPVVWVKAVDTFFYESSCGSGSIAAALVTNAKSVVQPAGKSILVAFPKGGVTLTSQMEVLHESD